jgi:hypothetical protein
MMLGVPVNSGRVAKWLAPIVLSMVIVSGCGGSGEQGPNADAAGLFPNHYSEKGFMAPGSSLLQGTAATAATSTYSFDVDAAHAFALVANCTGGRITVSGASGSCKGAPGGLVAFCAGQQVHFTAHVSVKQRHPWGVAIYRTTPC